MNIENTCVGIIVTLIILIATYLIDLCWFEEEEMGGWIISSIGFGICLTVLLYQNGLI